MEIRGTVMAFTDANVFRMYHLQISGKEPKLMRYGLTIGSQDRFHRMVTRRLSPPISFEDVYLSLALYEMEGEPRAQTLDENGMRLPITLPEFENGVQHDRLFDPKAKVQSRYLSFFRRDGMEAKLHAPRREVG